MAKLSISPEVAQELVKAGTPTRHKSVQTFRKLADSAQMGEEIRLARLQSAWQQNAAGVWYATACFIVNDVADTSSIVAVYAPVSNSNPGGTVAETRFYVVWRGRWESLDKPGVANVSVVKSATSITLTTTKKAFSIVGTRNTSNFVSSASLTKTRPSISFLSNVAVSNGNLVFTSTSQYVVTNCSLATTTASAVTGFTVVNADALQTVSGTVAPTQVVTDVSI